MRDALVTDLRLAGQHVTVLGDTRLNQNPIQQHATCVSVCDTASFHVAFARAVANVDLAWLIAPESGGAYQQIARQAEAEVQLVSPSADFASLAGHKQATSDFLIERGIASPRGRTWSVGQPIPDLKSPLVIKPNDGAGSRGVQRLHHQDQSGHEYNPLNVDAGAVYRVEEWIEGPSFSVAMLGCSRGFVVLEPCRQQISCDGSFRYQGGRLPVESPQRELLLETATCVAQVLPQWQGFIGLDIILSPTGAVVIEINPRLTTSYVGLRRFYRENLAKTVVDSLCESMVSLSSRNFQLQFDPYGMLSCLKVDTGAAIAPCDWQPWTSAVRST